MTEDVVDSPVGVCVFIRSVVSNSVTPWAVGHQASLSMGFSGQEYWSGLPLISPGDLPYPGIEPTSLVSPALGKVSLPAEPAGKPKTWKALWVLRLRGGVLLEGGLSEQSSPKCMARAGALLAHF